MGKLDFSVIDGRHKKDKASSTSRDFGGGQRSFSQKKAFLDLHKISYIETSSGNMNTIIDSAGRETVYMDNGQYQIPNIEIMQACREVIVDVKRYVKKLEASKGDDIIKKFHFPVINTQGVFDDNLYNFVVKGGKQLKLIDARHCYWRIAYNYGIISKRTYDKWKENRDARLVALGNLSKSKSMSLMIDGKKEVKVIKNKHEWVWDFICYKAYEAISSAVKACKNEVFSYNTDGVYLPPKYSQTALKVLRKFGLPSKSTLFQIVGISGHYCVLKDLSQGGFYKQASVGKIDRLREILPTVDYKELRVNDMIRKEDL